MIKKSNLKYNLNILDSYCFEKHIYEDSQCDDSKQPSKK